MDIGDALYRAITRGRSPATEGGSVASMVAEVYRALGVHGPPGISASTWRDLRAKPERRRTPATIRALRLAQRRARLSPAREAKLRTPRPTPTPFVIKGKVWISASAEIRELRIHTWEDDDDFHGTEPLNGLMDRMIGDWLAGEDAGMVDRLDTALSDHLGTTAHIGEVTSVKLP